MNRLTQDFINALRPKIASFCAQHNIYPNKVRVKHKIQVLRTKEGDMRVYLMAGNGQVREWKWEKDAPVNILDEVLTDLAFEICKELV